VITERVHAFGADDALLGIVTLPPLPLLEASSQRPFVVLLNAGLVHRVGPFGMGVQLARSLAALGFRVLRFDQSGLGDSHQRPGRAPIDEQVVADGRAAMDFLATRYHADTFVVGGLCSGALNAHRICLADERVVGIWMLDGYAYPTRRYYSELVLRSLRDRSSWPDLGRSLVAKVRARLRPPVTAEPAPRAEDDRSAIFYQDWPPITEARSEIERMLRRGVRFLFVYTGGWSNFVHRRQFDQMFPRLALRNQIRVAYYPLADHTYLALEDRSAMLRDVGNFVRDLAS
jgi:hypothetical protein